MCFATMLADSLNHSSLKAYLSAVRSLHIDNGLADPLINCLQLQQLLRETKQVQGSPTSKRLPNTIDVLQVIKRSLDCSSQDHIMLWTACCLGFFGFLPAGEFTTNSPFDPNIHLAVSDVQADTLQDPTCFQIHIKCSKTDPFWVGCYINVSRGSDVVCPVVHCSYGQLFSRARPFPRDIILFRRWPSPNTPVAVFHSSVSFAFHGLLG